MSRKMQFTIRGLLVAFVAFGFIFSWIAIERRRCVQEMDILADLAELCDGDVRYKGIEGMTGLRNVTYVSLPKRTYSRETVNDICNLLRQLGKLRAVDVQGSEFEGGIEALKIECPEIEFAYIDISPDSGIVRPARR